MHTLTFGNRAVGVTFEVPSYEPWSDADISEYIASYDWGVEIDPDTIAVTESPTYAVWYASVGCLPDADEPEFTGSLAGCEAYVEAMRADRDADPARFADHDLYDWSIDLLEGDDA